MDAPEEFRIRLALPDLTAEDRAAADAVWASGWLVQGAQVAAFESALSATLANRAVAVVSSGTAALHLSILALDLPPGSRIAVSALSWPASANAIVASGHQPVFVDCSPQDGNMDPLALQTVLATTSVQAVLLVHAFGAMADASTIEQLCETAGIPLVEDAACALGARRDGRAAGTFGVLAAFSFHPRKSITTGEGGAVAASNPGLMRRVRALRNHGLDPAGSSPEFILPGLNYRMTEAQAALGTSQMRRFDAILSARRRVAALYAEHVRSPGIRLPCPPPASQPAWQSHVVQLDEADHRDVVIASLRRQGIECGIGTYNQPMTRWYRETGGHRPEDHPGSHRFSTHALSLPMHPRLTETDVRAIAAALGAALEAPNA